MSSSDSVTASPETLLKELERRSQTIRYWELQCAKLVATGGTGPEWDAAVAAMTNAHCFGHACDFSRLVKELKGEDQ